MSYDAIAQTNRKEGCSMKRLYIKAMKGLSVIALVVTTVISNSACWFIAYQETMPEEAKKLRRF